MKRFRILGIIAIIMMAMHFIDFFYNEWNDVQKAWKDGYDMGLHARPADATLVNITVKPLSTTAIDSIANSKYGRPMPYEISGFRTYIKSPIWYFLLLFLGMPCMICSLYGFYCLIRLFISISRRQVLTPTNVWRLRWFTYSQIAMDVLIYLSKWLLDSALNQISLPGYEIVGVSEHPGSWVTIALFLLFTEIFAVAVKLQEEQDLTI